MIRTARTVLRPLCALDVTEGYRRWFDDPNIRRWILFAGTSPTLDSLRTYVEEKRRLPGCWFLGIYAGGRHIGNVKFEPDEHGGHHMGILIGDPAWRGCGIASEVLTVLCPIVALTSRCVWLGVEADHLAAQRVYERVGFRHAGQDAKGHWRYEWAHEGGANVG